MIRGRKRAYGKKGRKREGVGGNGAVVLFKTLKLGQGAGGELSVSQQQEISQVDTTHNREIPHANLFTEADSKALLYFCVFLSSFFFFFFFLISPTPAESTSSHFP